MTTRRTLVKAFALLPLAGCTTTPATTTTRPPERHDHLLDLERKFDARLGVYAVTTGSGASIAHRRTSGSRSARRSRASRRRPSCTATPWHTSTSWSPTPKPT